MAPESTIGYSTNGAAGPSEEKSVTLAIPASLAAREIVVLLGADTQYAPRS
jgi:hypothetical protein